MPALALKPVLLAIPLLGGAVHAAPLESAYVAGGCFWCVEADFEKVQGVDEVISGYSGGDLPNPTYRQVVAGDTGHYEAAEIRYDPDQVSYAQLMDLFFRSVDPTDGGGQFCDRGDSYRTAIFVQSEAERQAAEAAKVEAAAELGQEVVTPILRFDAFYEAEDYHQDYYKSDDRLPITSVGFAVPKSVAYERYRTGCGRDERIRQLWGDDAPFLP
ncbi:peptide-methionine (S)-S-oxide reductase MsrA [Roseitranquillus sediminis]|uniref:peptide-methionine (S)-S-oxide reductase MsrA n=1 Tax=Roseitranquillus sediminis TaxID=2809051 RepID=UPI001D0C46ED|nr:peptide-methionine (S)-S-oxide reductase MsrA [Roseitranquillus sediminis]MBM9593808.1 peptide-methionine (S)-S-oxide reductase MsrA [Roseitranquillus sediminis]